MQSRILMPALALAVVFALQSTASNAQTRIGTANSVNPKRQAASQARLRLVAVFTPARRFGPEAPARRACVLLTTATSLLDPGHRSSSTSLFMIQIKGPAALLLRPRAAHSDTLRARKTKVQLKSRRLPAPLAFAVKAHLSCCNSNSTARRAQ